MRRWKLVLFPSPRCVSAFLTSLCGHICCSAVLLQGALNGGVPLWLRGDSVCHAIVPPLSHMIQLMIETDAPYMTPEGLPKDIGIGKSKNEPCTLPAVARTIAACLAVPVEEVGAVCTRNSLEFFHQRLREGDMTGTEAEDAS